MQIILIPGRVAKARSFTLSFRHLFASAALGLAGLVGLSVALYWLTLRFAAEVRIPLVQELVLAAHRGEADRSKEFVRQNLNAMAVKLGELQAQMTRLDALGERLAGLAGIKPQEFRFSGVLGLGGPQAGVAGSRDMTVAEFNKQLASVARDVEGRTDMLGILESQLFEQTVRKKSMPTMMPVDAPFNASGFGWRIDPITGQQALHEGIDFITDTGAPIVAAAGGVIVFAGWHPQYGNVVDIDHGNELMTRYAHLSKILVEEGSIVQRGRRIGDSGSTGRSTGPHLHFEVRFRGAPQNPMRFLAGGGVDPVASFARTSSDRPAR
jgi:murein DD-endopeptidase MepM/ murein hydrolase activator NlpD